MDLTYITDRIIAMGFPASGVEATYRNSIDNVSSFLRERHGLNYLVFNLSERKYDYTKFNNQVPWCFNPTANTKRGGCRADCKTKRRCWSMASRIIMRLRWILLGRCATLCMPGST